MIHVGTILQIYIPLKLCLGKYTRQWHIWHIFLHTWPVQQQAFATLSSQTILSDPNSASGPPAACTASPRPIFSFCAAAISVSPATPALTGKRSGAGWDTSARVSLGSWSWGAAARLGSGASAEFFSWLGPGSSPSPSSVHKNRIQEQLQGHDFRLRKLQKIAWSSWARVN